MQANQNPSRSLYIVYTYRENVFLYAIYFIFTHLCSYFMKKFGGWERGRGRLFYTYDLILQTYPYMNAFAFRNVDFEV